MEITNPKVQSVDPRLSPTVAVSVTSATIRASHRRKRIACPQITNGRYQSSLTGSGTGHREDRQNNWWPATVCA